MKLQALLIASLLAISSLVDAALPLSSNVATRPPGFKHPSVEGRCSYADFKNEVDARTTDAAWPYSVERHIHKVLYYGGWVNFAIIYSMEDRAFNFGYGPGPNQVSVFTPNTTDDGERLELLREWTANDRDKIKTYVSQPLPRYV